MDKEGACWLAIETYLGLTYAGNHAQLVTSITKCGSAATKEFFLWEIVIVFCSGTLDIIHFKVGLLRRIFCTSSLSLFVLLFRKHKGMSVLQLRCHRLLVVLSLRSFLFLLATAVMLCLLIMVQHRRRLRK
jgi:hypothetical protein